MFTPAEESYLKSQLLARLATVAPDGTVQNSPVGFFLNDELNTFDIWGQRMGRTKKFANVTSYPRVALVIDDRVIDSQMVGPLGIEPRTP